MLSEIAFDRFDGDRQGKLVAHRGKPSFEDGVVGTRRCGPSTLATHKINSIRFINLEDTNQGGIQGQKPGPAHPFSQLIQLPGRHLFPSPWLRQHSFDNFHRYWPILGHPFFS
jgi:hypothetical protein